MINRRNFVLGMSTLAIPTQIVTAQTATPMPDEADAADKSILDYIDKAIIRPTKMVGRFFERPSASLSQRWMGELIFVNAIAAQFTDRNDSLPYGRALATAVRDHWIDGTDLLVSDLNPTSVRDLGDQAHAWTVNFESEDSEWFLGFVLTLQADYFQLLYGTVRVGSPVVDLADIAEAAEPRWPNTRPVRSGDDGMRTGGIWSILPTLSDVPEGMYFEDEFEITV